MHDAPETIRRTGGAVILCSLTTLLGYLALVRSVNFAVRKFGIAAVLGEVTCLLAAVWCCLPPSSGLGRGRRLRLRARRRASTPPIEAIRPIAQKTNFLTDD